MNKTLHSQRAWWWTLFGKEFDLRRVDGPDFDRYPKLVIVHTPTKVSLEFSMRLIEQECDRRGKIPEVVLCELVYEELDALRQARTAPPVDLLPPAPKLLRAASPM